MKMYFNRSASMISQHVKNNQFKRQVPNSSKNLGSSNYYEGQRVFNY